MYRRSIATVVTLALSAAAVPALACEQDPFLFRLPGETEAQAQERANRIFADQAVARLFSREAYALEKATHVYLARVVSTNRSPRSQPSTVVTPLEPLKGEGKADMRTLIDGGPGLCIDRGDGLGAYAERDELVVVFEGLPITTERPRGVDSLRAQDVRTVPLLYKLLALYGPEDQ